MTKEEMSRALGMLDEDVIADALKEKERGRSFARRRAFVAAIAAVLALAILASVAVIALGRGSNADERVNVLPPVGAEVIKHVASSSQITGATEYRLGSYPAPEATDYWDSDPIGYVEVGGLELSESLYAELVESDDVNRMWSIEVSISPNLYITKDYLLMQTESMLAQVSAEQLRELAELWEKIKELINIDVLYERYAETYELVDIYKYVVSGELDRDLIDADIEALKAKAQGLINSCDQIRGNMWRDIEREVSAELKSLGLPFVESGGSYVIFATEGELMSLSGLEGIKLDTADYKLTVNEIDPNAICERNGKRITYKLCEALAKNDGREVLYAVLVESEKRANITDLRAYEKQYLELMQVYASSTAVKEALMAAAAEGDARMEEAIALCGAEVVDKYIKGGSFDSELFESDLDAVAAEVDEMRLLLYGDTSAEIYDAFKPSVRYIEITDSGSVIIYVTAEELDALPATTRFVFSLAG